MKHLIRNTLGLVTLCTAVSAALAAQDPAPGYVDFGKFTPPAGGGEFVEVHINSNLISMAVRLTEKTEPEIAEALRGLQRIRVNVIGLNEHNRTDMEKRVQSIRDQLDASGWERVVTAQHKDEDVAVYLLTRGAEAVQGVVVTILGGHQQAVLVNIVGDIQPEKLAVLGERFDIDPLKKMHIAHKK